MREGDVVALNEDGERWCDLREKSTGTFLTRLLSGKKTSGQQNKEYVGNIALVNT